MLLGLRAHGALALLILHLGHLRASARPTRRRSRTATPPARYGLISAQPADKFRSRTSRAGTRRQK
ncbi:MAG: hypothetical protein ACLUEK_17220 [Oscillospiraceae bacterium]